MLKIFKKIGLLKLGLLSLVCLPMMAIVFNVANAIIIGDVDYNEYFIHTDGNGNKFKCYSVETTKELTDDEDVDQNENSAAISWFSEDVNNTYPENLVIPETVTDPKTNIQYKVRVIDKAGFRYCTSSSITLPTTIIKIKQEAFAYCENITEFAMPYRVQEIDSSTFLDCRNMAAFYYKDKTGSKLLGNNSITRIGDHAFDSCIKLKAFYCPRTVTEFGESCFQKCQSLTTFYFPAQNTEKTNDITIRKYAFADCSSLSKIYFEDNIKTVEHHAFVNALSSCVIDYYSALYAGTLPENNSALNFDAHWRDRKINNNDTNKIPVNPASQMKSSSDYEGLYYSVVASGNIKLNCGDGNVYYQNNESYIIIENFEPPAAGQEGYWDPDDGEIIIPDKIDNIPVKVIATNAFENTEELQKVKFNSHLVQIRNRAFWNCPNVSELDFTLSTSLWEISYDLFNNSSTEERYNSVSSLRLPASLQYIGSRAFYNFNNLTEEISFGGSNSQLKVIGSYAFAVSNKQSYSDNPESTIDLVLPASLDDAAAYTAKLKNAGSNNRGIAVQTGAFSRAWTLNSVTFASVPANDTKTVSLAQNAFAYCKNLFSFMSNKNLKIIGNNCFAYSTKLKEVYLSTEKAIASGFNYPYGIEDKVTSSSIYTGSIFCSDNGDCTYPDLVIYLSGTDPNHRLTGPNEHWNVERGYAYPNELNFKNFQNDSNLGYRQIFTRTSIPTYTNIDFLTTGTDIKYWNRNAGTVTTTRPVARSEFTKSGGMISFIKDENTSKYTVGRFYCTKDASASIDLTTIPDTTLLANLTSIGKCAFGSDNGSGYKNLGYYFILPDSITSIGERAFYRRSSDDAKTRNVGVRVVTYKSNNAAYVPTGFNKTYDQIVTGNSNGVGYCCLPSGVTRVDRDCFYNNRFNKVVLDSALNFIGNGAFLSITALSVTTSIEDGGNSIFTAGSDGGLYYTTAANKKVLVYMPTGNTGTLNIASGVNAIGMQAAADHCATTITLPNTLTHIYGGAFRNCDNLTTVNGAGLGTIEYISAWAGAEEIYDFNNTNLELYDYRNFGESDYYARTLSRNGAFGNCKNLTTIDFTKMTSLKAIGPGAFRDCPKLENLTDGSTYSFYKASIDGTTGRTVKNAQPFISKSNGILDLSKCTNLRTIGYYAFTNDKNETLNKFNVVITPDSTGTGHRRVESNMYVGFYKGDDGVDFWTDSREFFGRIVQKTDKTYILCGEDVYQAVDGLSDTTHATDHYTPKWQELCQTYYKIESRADIFYSQEKYRYWVKDGNDYVLFDNKEQAYKWFAS